MSMTNTGNTPVPTPFLSGKTYDSLKWVAQYGLPALGTLYFALATIWGLPDGEQVIGTITALDIFLGVVLGISTRSYNASGARYDGALVVDTSNPVKDTYSLEVSTPLNDVATKKEIVLKVQNMSAASQ
jgi:Putative phage holin Dp-1